MTNSKKLDNFDVSRVTRRHFIATTAAAATAFALVPGCGRSDGPSSRFKRVQIGVISYSFRDLPSSAEDILGYLVETGINSVELTGGPIEQFAGIPEGGPQMPRGVAAGKMSEEEVAEVQAAAAAAAEEQRKWRLSPPMDKFEELRKMYSNAGVDIHIAKLGSASWSDEEIDYAFNVARTLGAKGITMEWSDETMLRMGPFSMKHEMLVGGHNHTQVGEPGFTYDTGLSFSSYNAINLDVGHYVAGTNEDPIPVIEK